jgi:hypothetical protein
MIEIAVLFGVIAAIAIVLGVLQHRGYPVVSTIKSLLLIVFSVVPILTLVGLFVYSFFHILGFELIREVSRYDNLLKIYFWSFLFFVIPSTVVAIIIVRSPGEKLRAIDGETGKTGGWELLEKKWETLTVEDFDGNEIGKDGLHKVPWYKGSGWEADLYYPDENRAVTSFYAGMTPSEIRHRKHAIRDIRGELLKDFDAGVRTSAEREHRARKDAASTSNRIVRDHERAMLPQGELPEDPVRERINEHDSDEEEDNEDDYRDGEVYQDSPESGSGDGSESYQQADEAGGDE